MSETSVDAVAIVDQRLARDGITIDEEERQRLIGLVPVAQEWVRRITIPETRYAEPALSHRVK
jgi:hypothetical protein